MALFSAPIDNQEISPSVKSMFQRNGIKVLHQKILNDMCIFGFTNENIFLEWIKETFESARIFVIIGETDCHLNLLKAMDSIGLFEEDNNEKYFVIGVNSEVWDKSGKF